MSPLNDCDLGALAAPTEGESMADGANESEAFYQAEERAGMKSDAAPAKPSPKPKKPRPVRVVQEGETHDARPMIRVEKGEGHRQVEAVIAALVSDCDLYERTGALAHVVGAEKPPGSEDDNGEAIPGTGIGVGAPIVRPMAHSTLWERCSRYARWEKWDGRAARFVPDDPPKTVLAAVLSRGDYPGIRRLTGILECPALRPDGSLIIGRGYDALTGFLCCPSIDFLAPSDAPTQAEAAAALAELDEVFCDFPHRSAADRMVPIAAILTMLARPVLGACPAFVFDASTRGSGKTLQADAVLTICTGRVPPPLGYTEKDEEQEKKISAIARFGPVAVKWDNIVGRFGGGALDAALTANGSLSCRILGLTELAVFPWSVVQLATGNNIEFRADTARRCLVSRIEPNTEHPENRTDFRHPRLIEWIKVNRARLVRAGLTVLRAWIVAGRPGMGCGQWGSFESWAATIPPAIAYAGGADPLACRPAETGEEEPEKAALRGVLVGLERLDPGGAGMTCKSILQALYPDNREKGPPDGYDDVREAIEGLAPMVNGKPPTSKTLGEKLKQYGHGRIIDGLKLASESDRNGVKRWRVVRAH